MKKDNLMQDSQKWEITKKTWSMPEFNVLKIENTFINAEGSGDDGSFPSAHS